MGKWLYAVLDGWKLIGKGYKETFMVMEMFIILIGV
jgi:hypothetical protein